MIYPQQSYILEPHDIGNYFVRTKPHGDDWSHVPKGKKDIDLIRAEVKLVCLTAKRIVVRENDVTIKEYYPEWNDGGWIKVEVLKGYMFTRVLNSPGRSLRTKVNMYIKDDLKKDASWQEVFDRLSKVLRENLRRPAGNVYIRKMPSKIGLRLDPWYETLRKKLKEVSNSDHSYQPPISPKLDPTSGKPHDILGLPEDVRDLELIKRQWQKLALQHHPDKGGNAELFKKIDAAYRQLKNEIEGEAYSHDGGDDAESALIKARSSVSNLLRREVRPSLSEFPFYHCSWQSVFNALVQVKLEGLEPVIKDEIFDLRDLAEQKVKFWDFRNKLASIPNATIENLKAFAKEYRLKEWVSSIPCCFQAKMIYYDKLVACYRSQAEKHIVAEEMDEALRVRNDVREIAIKIAKIKLDFILSRQPTRMQKRDLEEEVADIAERIKNMGRSKKPAPVKPEGRFSPRPETDEDLYEGIPLHSQLQPELRETQKEKPKKEPREELEETVEVKNNLSKNFNFFQIN